MIDMSDKLLENTDRLYDELDRLKRERDGLVEALRKIAKEKITKAGTEEYPGAFEGCTDGAIIAHEALKAAGVT